MRAHLSTTRSPFKMLRVWIVGHSYIFWSERDYGMGSIYHNNLRYNKQGIYRGDGVHFTDEGNRVFLLNFILCIGTYLRTTKTVKATKAQPISKQFARLERNPQTNLQNSKPKKINQNCKSDQSSANIKTVCKT
ncbi:uncharacterized protein LOC144752023 [Lissotriton helveticus]